MRRRARSRRRCHRRRARCRRRLGAGRDGARTAPLRPRRRRRRRRGAGRRGLRRALRGERAAGPPTDRSWWCSIRSTAPPTRLAASPGTRCRCARSTPTGRRPPWSSTWPAACATRRCGAAAPGVTASRSQPSGQTALAESDRSGCRASRRAGSAGGSTARSGAAALDLCAVAEGVLDGYVDCSRDAHGVVGLPGWAARVPRGGRGGDRRLRPRARGARPRRAPHARRRRPRRRCCAELRRGPPELRVIERLHGLLLRVFRRLPARARRAAVHMLTPSYYVGAMCVVQRDDGRRLFVRHTYRERWGMPGGLLNRGEDVARRGAARGAGGGRAARRARRRADGGRGARGATRRRDLRGPPRRRRRPRRRCARARPRSPSAAGSRPDDLPLLQHETAGALVTLARARRPGESVDRLDPELRHGRSTAGPRSGGAASRGRGPRSGGSAPG